LRIAFPCPWYASRISAARASRIGIPLRESAKSTSQRKANENWRSGGTSNGTW
jgi:hypothetical protein